jgi:hypothetical protein
MLSALFTSVADALISYAIDKLDPAERIKSWLRLDPARLAFKKALARAYSAFARQYPEYTSSLFDQSFLSTEALPELSKLLTRNQHPDPALLAQAWGRSLGANTDFAQAATKPAAYFIERFEAELKTEPALQSIFDSRALESLPKLESEIQKLSTELQRGLDEALKAASNYQKVTLHISGDVKDSNIVIGNNNIVTNNVINNYYYSGDFIALNEYYIPPDGVFQRVRVDEFIGRDWLTTKVDAFLNDPNRKSGAFLLIGDAGVGKTSFMAHLVKERRYLHLFAEQAPGQAMLQRAMQSLASQLVSRYQIDPYKDRDTLNALSVFPDFLERILRLAASTLTEGEKIVIVCDALDEAGVFPDHFVFGLPKELPDGVYFILSQRPVNVKLPNFEPVIENLEAQGEGNLQDIEAYLSAVAKRPEVAGQIRSKEYSEEFFIQTLKEKSQGVWMYLHYIIKEIESGARAPLDLGNLPTGLVGYYAEYWDAWRTGKRGKGEEVWDELYAPLLTTLAAAQEAIPVDWLIQWADVTAKPREVTRLLTEHWRAFITEKEKDGQKTYTPYHLSFKDFITGRVDTSKLSPAQANLVKDLAAQTVDSHKRIVTAFEKECNGEWEKLVEQDYPRLHLTAHLNAAGEYEKLRIMLTEGDEKIKWAEAREKKEETYAGYLNDLTYAWVYAERKQNYALAIRCMLIESSINSLATNIPPELLGQLANAGVWSYARCLSTILQKPKESEQSGALAVIVNFLPVTLFDEILDIVLKKKITPYFLLYSRIFKLLTEDQKKRAIFACRDGVSGSKYSYALLIVEILPELSKELSTNLVKELLSVAQELENALERIRVSSSLLPYMDDKDREASIQFLLEESKKIQDIGKRTAAFCCLFDCLEEEIKTPLIAAALSDIRNSDVGLYRIHSLISLAKYCDKKLRANIINEAINITNEIEDEEELVEFLEVIIPLCDEKLKYQVFQQALDGTRKIKSENSRAFAIARIAPYTPDTLKEYAVSIALEIKHEPDKVRALSGLAPHLDDNLLSQVFTIVCKVRHEYSRSNALSEFAYYISDNQVELGLSAAREIGYSPYRARALSAFSSRISPSAKESFFQEVLSASRKIDDSHTHFEVLRSLSSYFSEENKSKIISNAQKSKDEYLFFIVISALAPTLNAKLKKRSLNESLKIKDKLLRARTLVSLAPYLNKEQNKQAIYEALLFVDEIPDDAANTLTELAPYIDDKQKDRALLSVGKVTADLYRSDLLIELIPHLNDIQKKRSLSLVEEMHYESSKSHVLATVIPYLNKELRTYILSIAQEYKETEDRSKILLSLLPYLKGKAREQVAQEVLSDIHKSKSGVQRAVIVDMALSLLDKDTQNYIFKEIYLIDENMEKYEINRHLILLLQDWRLTKDEKIDVYQKLLEEDLFRSRLSYWLENWGDLEILINKWMKIDFAGLDEKLHQFIKTHSTKKRDDAKQMIGILTPALVHFSGPEIADELYRTITDVTRWWP